MKTHNQRIGKWGEDTVIDYLTERSYKTITRNARTPYGEIDIVHLSSLTLSPVPCTIDL